jgi:hypothetical protein
VIEKSELLSWSLFALNSNDEEALGQLSKLSVLRPPKPTELESIKYDIRAGRKIALSLKSPHRPIYFGLCVFGLESPSPVGDKAIGLDILSLEQYPRMPGPDLTLTSEEIESALLDEVKRFCRTHGYTRVHCYASAQPSTIAQFAKLNFEPQGTFVDGRSMMFSLALHLAPAYTGDPYDGRHLLNWIAEQLQLDSSRSNETRCECALRLDHLNSDLADTPLGDARIPVLLELQTAAENSHLKIGFGSISYSDSSVSLTVDQLRQLTRVPRLNMALWPPPEEGASIAVEIRSELFGRFSSGRQNAYFDSGSYGTLLESAIDKGAAPHIFFVDFETTATNPRLIGVARVRSVQRGSPEDLWRQWGAISSWPDAEEFARYRAIKRKMTVIVFDNLRSVDTLGAGLPTIGHSWTYVPARQAYSIARLL